MPVSRLARGHARDVLAADQHLPGGGAVEPGEQPQRRGLAAARRAEQREQLAGLELQVEPVERVRGAEAAPDAPELDGAVPDCRPPVPVMRRPSLAAARERHGSSNSQVSSRLASDSATATPAWLCPTTTIATGNVSVYSRIRAITISPSTSASVRNAEPSTALRIAGSTTRSSAVRQARAEVARGLHERAQRHRGQPVVDRAVGERQRQHRRRTA